ncbi:MAG TPA: toxin glutamine deamidase domain-containing protein, partial [Pilimelia sp.]|nr:toxin glutamine deamidase domain-containing protein [Pilimelia sp.]
TPPPDRPGGPAGGDPPAAGADAGTPRWEQHRPLVVVDDDSPVTGGRRYDHPGGHRRPLADQQLALELAIPRGDDGRATRMPDPRRTDYLALINPGAREGDPSRAANATDCALSFYDTWMHGRPRVAAPRTRDGYRLGDPHAADGHGDDGPARVVAVTGGAFQNLCPSVAEMDVQAAQQAVNRALRSLHAHLRAAGPGAFAFLVHRWEGGNAHVWTAVNQDGTVLYLDPVVGHVAVDAPLYGHYGRPYDGNVDTLDALVLGPDGAPRPLPDHPDGVVAAARPPDPGWAGRAAADGPGVTAARPPAAGWAGPALAPEPDAGWAGPAVQPPAPDLDLLMMDAPELAAAVADSPGVRAALRAESSAVAMLWWVRAEVAGRTRAAVWPPGAEAVQPDFDAARRHDRAYVAAYLDDLHAAAVRAVPELAALAARAAGPGARVRPVPVPQRVAAAAQAAEWHGDAARLVDLAVVKIEVPDLDALRAVRERLCDADADTDVGGVVAVEDGVDGDPPGGYPHVRVAVRTGSGHVGVVRICLRDVEHARRWADELGALRQQVLDAAADQDRPAGPVERMVADGLAALRGRTVGAAWPAPQPASGGVRYLRWRLSPVKVVEAADGPAGWRLLPTSGGWERLAPERVAALLADPDPWLRRLTRARFVQEVEAERARLLRGVGPAGALYAVVRAVRQRALAARRPLTAEERAWVAGIGDRTYALTEGELADRGDAGADPRPEVPDTP